MTNFVDARRVMIGAQLNKTIKLSLDDVRLYAVNRDTKAITELNDYLYFFEDEGITNDSGCGHGDDYDLFIESPAEAHIVVNNDAR